MKDGDLQRHVLATYQSLRRGVGILTFAFPFVVWGIGRLHGIGLQHSISAYYWAGADGETPARVCFVGVLFALATFFALYRGFTWKEDVAFNLAGAFAVGVAYLPMPWPEGSGTSWFSLHGACAIALFACLVYVVWWRSSDTLGELKDPALERGYRQKYAAIAVLMGLSPIAAFVLNTFVAGSQSFVFFAESCGIWAFGVYWWVKNGELERSSAVQKALRITAG